MDSPPAGPIIARMPALDDLVTSPRPAAGDPEAPLARASPFARWRTATLILVYVLMVAHVVHWQLAGSTLAPLELHEVMYTAELGVVTAGFLFMACALLATAVFGRFFCGWACHLLALQDLAAWLLKKLRIRRKPIRARWIAWAPFAVMFYMFVWPQLARMFAGRPHPGFRFAGDDEPIASFTTTNFWRNLPDPWVATLTFVVCGGVAIYVLGSRGFCQYACPYGALFGMLDKLAPGRVRVDDKCRQCGTCTKVCTSGISVHEQLRTHGAVIDPRCIKDLDCVGACPHDALHYGFGAPSLLLRQRPGQVPRPRAGEFSRGEEAAMAVVFLVTVIVYRGLYGLLPFLLSVGLGAITACTAVVSWRLLRRPEVTVGRQVLKQGGRLTKIGLWSGAGATALLLCTLHSAVVRLATWRGEVAYAAAANLDAASRRPEATRAVEWLRTADRWSLVASDDSKAQLAWAEAMAGNPDGALSAFAAAVALAPDRADHHYYYAGFLARAGRPDAAIAELTRAIELDPARAELHERLAQLLRARGDVEAAERELATARRLAAAAQKGPR